MIRPRSLVLGAVVVASMASALPRRRPQPRARPHRPDDEAAGRPRASRVRERSAGRPARGPRDLRAPARTTCVPTSWSRAPRRDPHRRERRATPPARTPSTSMASRSSGPSNRSPGSRVCSPARPRRLTSPPRATAPRCAASARRACPDREPAPLPCERHQRLRHRRRGDQGEGRREVQGGRRPLRRRSTSPPPGGNGVDVEDCADVEIAGAGRSPAPGATA